MSPAPAGANFPEAWLADTLEAAAGCPAYPVMGREGTLPPYVVFNREGTQDDMALDDELGEKVVSTGTFSVDIYADGYLQAKGIAAAVKMAVRNFSGHSGSLTIIRSVVDDDRDGPPVLLDGRDTPTYTIEQSYRISWLED